MIATLKAGNVNWVILGDIALDGREDLRFKNTHRIVWQHFNSEFEPVDASGLPGNYQLLHRRQDFPVVLQESDYTAAPAKY